MQSLSYCLKLRPSKQSVASLNPIAITKRRFMPTYKDSMKSMNEISVALLSSMVVELASKSNYSKLSSTIVLE